jgi:plasmid maintenance system antidote protein VapI
MVHPETPNNFTRMWEGVHPNADAIRRELICRGWSLKDWAREAEVADKTAARLIRGKALQPQKAYKLLRALGGNLNRWLRNVPDHD